MYSVMVSDRIKTASLRIILSALSVFLLFGYSFAGHGPSGFLGSFVIVFGIFSTVSGLAFIFDNWKIALVVSVLPFLLFITGRLPSSVGFGLIIFFVVFGILFEISSLSLSIASSYRFNRILFMEEKQKALTGFYDIESAGSSNIEICTGCPGFDSLNDQVSMFRAGIANGRKIIAEMQDDKTSYKKGLELVSRINNLVVNLKALNSQFESYMRAYYEYQDKQSRQYHSGGSPGKEAGYSFFKDCDDLESLNKRYRDLVKVYHPDQGNGSSDSFKEIQSEYEELKKRFT